jgi:hypothetical protein
MTTNDFHNSHLTGKAVEAVTWDPRDHTDLPGFAHGLTRYGSHWMDIGISVIPVDVSPLEALEAVFGRLREIVAQDASDVEYFTVDLRVASRTPPRRPDFRTRATALD